VNVLWAALTVVGCGIAAYAASYLLTRKDPAMGLPDENDLSEPDASAFSEGEQTSNLESPDDIGPYAEADIQDPDANGAHG
jgi:hypothetical protein